MVLNSGPRFPERTWKTWEKPLCNGKLVLCRQIQQMRERNWQNATAADIRQRSWHMLRERLGSIFLLIQPKISNAFVILPITKDTFLSKLRISVITKKKLKMRTYFDNLLLYIEILGWIIKTLKYYFEVPKGHQFWGFENVLLFELQKK